LPRKQRRSRRDTGRRRTVRECQDDNPQRLVRLPRRCTWPAPQRTRPACSATGGPGAAPRAGCGIARTHGRR
jgi:hypothetical protein